VALAEQTGLEICAGLKAIHELDCIHRDLKVLPSPLEDLELFGSVS
jgi:serine/threonine protein kinase